MNIPATQKARAEGFGEGPSCSCSSSRCHNLSGLDAVIIDVLILCFYVCVCVSFFLFEVVDLILVVAVVLLAVSW